MNTDPQKTAYLLKCMMDNMSDMIYFKDRNSRFIMVNKAAAQWQGGCTPEELVGKSDFDSYSDEDARRMRHDELRIMQTGEPLFGLEEGETRKDGSHAWVSSTKMPLRNEVGEVIGIFGISRDITEHKEAELRAEKLAEENSRFRLELEEDLLMASQLQKTFFPHSYPTFQSLENGDRNLVEFSHFHRPGGLIGGDLCSIRKISETEAGIFLCDVMGHGVRAALGTSIVRAVVEENAHHKIDPGDFLQHMNQVLMPLFRQEGQFLFATACYMVLDISSGVVRMANAGHPMPIVLEINGQRAECFADDDSFAGPGLAIVEDAVYETIERTIKRDDVVLMYTDGLNEVVGADGEEFGEKGLLASVLGHMDLPLSDLFPALHAEACRFGGIQALEDDVCMVGFRMMS
ncbi:SpoIIE family protein phosphatase [Pontiellaceae bacterium B12227]|nr:SpoIIE family protein phosphatase [Pontiellaceae bacterium B12227]